jgi:hypothetical protein
MVISPIEKYLQLIAHLRFYYEVALITGKLRKVKVEMKKPLKAFQD